MLLIKKKNALIYFAFQILFYSFSISLFCSSLFNNFFILHVKYPSLIYDFCKLLLWIFIFLFCCNFLSYMKCKER